MTRKAIVVAALLAVVVVYVGQAHAQFTSEGCSACGETCDAHDALDAMDSRAPVPLLPMMADHQKRNMRDHLLAVQEIVAALAADDFAAIERSAGRIGYSEQMGQMCEHMGAGAPSFTQQALAFHHTADTILDAARKQDPAGVLRALSSTLQTCTACHAAFRQRVVDEGTWQDLTSQPPPTGHGRTDEP